MTVTIDGSRGEGGGQILRTSLALSMITGKPLAMRRIRAGRAKPGLRRQHVACVEAATQLCGAGVSGVQVGSQALDFTPGRAWSDSLEIDIGSAGSATLVIQTILVPAIVSGKPLRAVITGGTHNPLAPPFDFLDRVFVPHLRAMGANVTLSIERVGLIPKGGGRVIVEVAPGPKLRPIQIVETGEVVARRATAIIAGLPRHVAERELAVAKERLKDPVCDIDDVPDAGPANVFMIEAELASGARELVTSHGEKGLPAEIVAARAIEELTAWRKADVPVGEHLADQLLLPMTVAGGGRYRTVPLSLHATTNLDTIAAFVDISDPRRRRRGRDRMSQRLIAAGAINGALSVGAGAFAAHGLRDHLEPKLFEAFETGARYHMYHALAIVLAGVLVERYPASTAAGWIFQLGIVLFSGSLYALALTGEKALGAITPFGGLAFLAGWVWLAYSAVRSARSP